VQSPNNSKVAKDGGKNSSKQDIKLCIYEEQYRSERCFEKFDKTIGKGWILVWFLMYELIFDI